mgnify:CR=1 FL=1
MKKVLALVLAVVMVCTMALAVDVAVTPKPLGSSDGEIGQVTLSDLKETYVLVLDEAFFDALQPTDPADKLDITAKNFTVTSKVKGSFTEIGGKKVYAFEVANTDKALDGKADFTISELKIALKNSRNSYVTYTAKNGLLVATEFKLGGLSQGTAALERINETLGDFYSAYDVGYETNTDMSNIKTSWKDSISPIWNLFNKDLRDVDVISGDGITVTLTGIPKNTPFKIIETEVELTPAGEKALDKNLAANGDPYVSYATDYSLEMTAGKATIVLEENEDLYIYSYDKNGKLTDAGFKFTVEKDPRTGVETGYWTLTTNKLGALLISEGPLTAAAASGTSTGSTTTNPGTGANDVVGVAAALAVVALVSGAAISLKK